MKNKQGIGQHRSDGSSLNTDMGQKSTVVPGARVGQENGPAFNMTIKGTAKDADISTEKK